jgi:hypothetical protein
MTADARAELDRLVEEHRAGCAQCEPGHPCPETFRIAAQFAGEGWVTGEDETSVEVDEDDAEEEEDPGA